MTRVPAATYRLQLGEGVGFDRARALLPYLDALGVDTLYLSPPFAAEGGGGYHVTDPTRLDPSLGGEAAFDRLAAAVHERGMGLLIDIVPSHMKASPANPWWADVLRHGPGSRAAPFFDIDWGRHGGKILLPVLTEPGAREETEHTIRAYWREALPDLNYRRFFDITDLVCLRQEDPAVWDATHELILRLVREEKVTGLRVDHVDGLRDPLGYLERLRAAAPHAYLVVEKILGPEESLPEDWPVDGTTGYEVGTAITDVLTDPGGAAACEAAAARFSGDDRPFADVLHDAKLQVLRELFPGDVRRLVERLGGLPDAPEVEPGGLAAAVAEATAHLPVYRTYIRDGHAGSRDRALIEEALEGAHGCAPPPRALSFLRSVLLEAEEEPARGDVASRWQLLTGPAMAKGLEDTALYRHPALLSRNEVGSAPGEPPLSPEAFHLAMGWRAERTPHGLGATSTHDSKRGEDARARLAALSELPAEWEGSLRAWAEMVPRREVGGTDVPDRRETILLLQTLLGVWPPEGDPGPDLAERVEAYVVKAAREAKVHSSWLDPDPAHEEALGEAVAGLLASERFLRSFRPVAERIALRGAVNGLAQVVLRTAVPGVPDLYRGAELWHLRLVDPDNRAPVNLSSHQRMLEDLDARAEVPGQVDGLRDAWPDGRLKLWVTSRALRLRRSRRDLFRDGDYLPVEAAGSHAEHVLTFARRAGGSWAVAAVSRLTARLDEGWPLGKAWGDTELRLPAEAPAAWRDALTGAAHEYAGGIPAASLFRRLPVALLEGER